MPSPSSSLATLRPDLAESFMEFDLAMDAQGFISNQVFPVVEVAQQSGNFGKIPVEQLLQSRDTKRAPGSGYARGNFTFDDATYACQEHGAEEPVDDREAAMYRDYFDAELIASQRAYSAVLRNAEQRVADALFNPSTFTPTSVSNEWDDATNATPLTDVEAAVQSIYDASGLWANSLIINQKVFRNLRNCDQIIDRINSAGAGSPSKASDVTMQMLAEVFALDRIIVAGASKNTAKEGQDASISQIWSGEYAMVAKLATSSDFREPCVGRTFHWSADGSSIGGTVETYRDESVRSDITRVRHDVDEIVLYPEAAELLDNITT
jgi:hypothetical protein